MSQTVKEGRVISELHLKSIRSTRIRVPDPFHLVHLQFRRFAGCPVCDLHLHTMARRHVELVAASIQEVTVFHSTVEELLPYCEELPFETIADPEKTLYAQFGVESGIRALISPRVWSPILRGVLRSCARTLIGRAPLPPLNPGGGRFGLPADFLIARSGMVAACKYGSHAYDQWSVDEILAISERIRNQTANTARQQTAAAIGSADSTV